MYEELVKQMRERADTLYNASRLYDSDAEDAAILYKAADAIEELSREIDIDNVAMIAMDAAMPKWIPVTERLPIGGDDSGAICENVCLLMDDGTVSCGWMNGITKKVYYLNARDDVVIKAPITRVTHWMPLPSTEGLNET